MNNLGYAYYLSGNLEKAEFYVLEAKKMNSKNSFVYRNLGLIKKAQDNKEEACEFLNKAIKLKIIEEWGMSYIQELVDYCNQ